jgi:hypothetical protein
LDGCIARGALTLIEGSTSLTNRSGGMCMTRIASWLMAMVAAVLTIVTAKDYIFTAYPKR